MKKGLKRPERIWLKQVLKKIFYYAASVLLNRIFSLLPLKEKRVLFLSDVRDSLGGNLGCVFKSLPEGFEAKTSLKADRRAKRSLRDFFKESLYIATSKYIFLEDFTASTAYIRVRKGQELIQLWHGSGAFKKFAHSREGTDLKRIHAGYKRYTMAITSSEFIRPCYAEAFSIPTERVIASGVPRTDVFFDEKYKDEKRKDLYGRFPEIKGKKVILFAPTYRGSRVEEAYYDMDMLDLEKLSEAFKGKYVFLIKWHPALENNIRLGKIKGPDLENFKGFAYDVSDIREVNDLLFAADILVTDYSSVIFDYALLKKPVVYFVYDLEKYADDGRGLYFPFEDYVYGETARDSEELIEAIKEEKLDEEKLKIFTEKFISANDGCACQKTVRAVFGRDI